VSLFFELLPTYEAEKGTIDTQAWVSDGSGQGYSSGESLGHVFWDYEICHDDDETMIQIKIYSCRCSSLNSNLLCADENGIFTFSIPYKDIRPYEQVQVKINDSGPYPVK